MTMMISKFHKLIQSKVVWYIVLGVIVIAFVGFFTPTMGNKSSKPKEQSMGTLFGEKVSQQDYRRALQNTKIGYILSTGRRLDTTREVVEALQQQAWQRLAMLYKAGEEKVIVSDQEVITQIQRTPIFANQNGVFNKATYQAVLGQIGLSPRQVENVFREQIVLQKLAYRPMQAALISPTELERAYHMYTDRIVVDYALLPREQAEKGASVTREEAEAFFNENIEAFRMPAKVRVSYVEYPVADFIALAEVPEGAALQVYNQNLENYRIENEEVDAPVEYQPFEEVEAEITTKIAEFSARRLALEQATSLVADIAPKSQNEAPDFNAAAAVAGLSVKTLPAVGPSGELPGIDPTAPFRQAAFGLQDDIYSSFSDAVVGKDSVYVLSLEQRYDSFLPFFEAVEKEATEAARAKVAAEIAAKRVFEIRAAVSDALAAGTEFKKAVKPFGLSVQTTEAFDLTSELDNEYAEALIKSSITVPQGKLCPVIPVEDGILFAYVAQRSSTDAEIGLPALRGELINGLSGVRMQRLAADWQAAVMEEADLQLNEN